MVRPHYITLQHLNNPLYIFLEFLLMIEYLLLVYPIWCFIGGVHRVSFNLGCHTSWSLRRDRFKGRQVTGAVQVCEGTE